MVIVVVRVVQVVQVVKEVGEVVVERVVAAVGGTNEEKERVRVSECVTRVPTPTPTTGGSD